MSDHVLRNALVLADSGYHVLQKFRSKTVLPYKRRRKVFLTTEQKTHNKTLSSKRILIEYVFAQLKKFTFLGSTYGIFRKKTPSPHQHHRRYL
ncbi:MAG: transposase [Alphaproteobacteria bacterium]|nr:transposase [Alphaproteobacteria bacterium]